MNYEQIETFLYSLWEDSQEGAPPPTFFITGPPGIGKSTVAATLAEKMGPEALLEVIDLTSRLPEDLGGLPFRDEKRDQVRYSPQDWMQRISKPGARGVLVLDDLPAASPSLSAASRQLALSRSINGVVLSPGIVVIVTGNRQKDRAGAVTLPSHFRNAVCTIEMEPQFKGWVDWFHSVGGNPLIPRYLMWKVDNFSMHPDDADTKGSFATPRSWALLSRCMGSAERTQVLPEITSGFVGEGVSISFQTFMERNNELPPIVELLRNPQGVLPKPEEVLNTADRMIGAVTGLGQMAALQWKADNDPVHQMNLLLSLHWVTKHNKEYVASGLDAYQVTGGSAHLLGKVSEHLRTQSPDIDEMLSEMKQDLA